MLDQIIRCPTIYLFSPLLLSFLLSFHYLFFSSPTYISPPSLFPSLCADDVRTIFRPFFSLLSFLFSSLLLSSLLFSSLLSSPLLYSFIVFLPFSLFPFLSTLLFFSLVLFFLSSAFLSHLLWRKYSHLHKFDAISDHVWPPNWQQETPGYLAKAEEREKEIMSLTGSRERWENWMQHVQVRTEE